MSIEEGSVSDYFFRMLPPPDRDPEDPLEDLPEDPPEEPRDTDEDPVLGADRVTDPLEDRPEDDVRLGGEKDR